MKSGFWKDVNGIITTDPEIVPSAKTLPKASFSEAMEMTYFGAKVIHPKAIEQIENKEIPLKIRSG